MGIRRFQNHAIIKEFNGLKKFFRAHETSVSRRRIGDFKRFVSLIESSGDTIGFDLMGSVNFGQATEHSDTDVVMYLHCDTGRIGECDNENCTRLNLYKNLLINTLVYEYSNNTYPVQVVDCINLNQLDYDLKIRNYNSLALVKFGFYRSICRGVNRKLLYQYEQRLEDDNELCDVIESSLADCFLGLIHSSQHSYSFKKYIERVEDGGFKVPETMAKKINSYLSY
ncbi:MAG TPA: hypothetical protein PK079_06810 [Leptospiraceae bacterium]|nr:hypothetical protein [Leptospiraceae bacterium]HMW07006.1 hypothetical protein [Leptospiraceae bacterium]HMX33404.1 hypothetical protein [Leptospiraceae bacterium]HMY30346.1 hypothetical protein [Leptospiraceae bacterium]HMZ65130.1 hypothetical protein [Leptospiraceae bacterium]